MATDVDQSCYEWSREEFMDQGDSGEISVSQMLDHGSISFGRFALESLSWEKRSVFTHNRYQEELEKLRAPGLVAQKKAYFEEHYKRIRAMKALQQNQHMNPVSCCGYSSNISEIMEGKKGVVQSECHEDVMVKSIGHGIEAASTDVTLEIDGETELVEPDSPTRFLNDDKYSESFLNSKQCPLLDKDYINHEPTMRNLEVSEHHDFRRLDNQQQPCEARLGSISGLIGQENQTIAEEESHGDDFENSLFSVREKASTEVPLGIGVESALPGTDVAAKLFEVDKIGESARSKQLQCWDQNLFYHEPTAASIEDSMQLGFISQEKQDILLSEKYVPNESVYSTSFPKILELKLNNEQKKVNQAVKGHKSYAYSAGVMKYSSSSGGFIKSEHKTKSRTVMLTQSLRDSSQKRKGQINVGIISPKQTVDRILSSKHASATSHGSPKEVHPKVTTPRPFSSANRKRSVSSTGVSPIPDMKNMLSSSPHPPNNIISKDVSSREGVSYCLQRHKLENRRGHEELGKKPFATDREVAHLMDANNVITPLKARSVNLPACLGGVDVGTNSEKLARNSDNRKMKMVEMMSPSMFRDLTLDAKNSPHSNNSSNRRKLRQEKPRWR